jgi:hypothetical protein
MFHGKRVLPRGVQNLRRNGVELQGNYYRVGTGACLCSAGLFLSNYQNSFLFEGGLYLLAVPRQLPHTFITLDPKLVL